MAFSKTELGPTGTAVLTEDGVTTILYHGTPVVRFNEVSVRLFTGGYRTTMTRVRMNQAGQQYSLGYNEVYQRKFKWYVNVRWQVGDVPFSSDTLIVYRWDRIAQLLANHAEYGAQARIVCHGTVAAEEAQKVLIDQMTEFPHKFPVAVLKP